MAGRADGMTGGRLAAWRDDVAGAALDVEALLRLQARTLFRYQRHGEDISVHEYGLLRWLQFGSPAIQSAMRTDAPTALMLSYLPLMMAFHLFVPAPRHGLLLGLGGGAIARHLHALHPQLRQTVVESRPVLGEICHDYFSLPRDPRRIALRFHDAMDWLRREGDGAHDVLMVDLYGRDSLPFFMYEPAFYARCRAQLATRGMLVINLLVPDRDELAFLLGHLRQAFDGRSLCLNVPGQHNVIVLASRGEMECRLAVLRERAAALGVRLGVDYPGLVTRLANTNPVREDRLVVQGSA